MQGLLLLSGDVSQGGMSLVRYRALRLAPDHEVVREGLAHTQRGLGDERRALAHERVARAL